MSTAKFKVNPNRKPYIQRRRRRRRQRDPGKNANQHDTSGPYTKFQPNLPQNMPTLKYRVQSTQTNDRRCPRRNSQEEEEEEKEEICPPWSRPPNQTPKKPHEKERPSPPLPTRSTNQPTMARIKMPHQPHIAPNFPRRATYQKEIAQPDPILPRIPNQIPNTQTNDRRCPRKHWKL